MLRAAVLSTARLGLPEVKTFASFIARPGLVSSGRTNFRTLKCLSSSWQPSQQLLHGSALCRVLPTPPVRVRTLLLVACRRCSGQYSKSEITRDILIYKNNRGTFFKILGFFAFAQLIFWTYLTHTAYLTMRDTKTYIQAKYGEEGPPEDVRNWKTWSGIRMQLSSGMWRYTITLLSITAGSIIFISCFLYSRKSIYRIVLRKGGQDVTIQTYGLFGLPWRFTTSLQNVSCKHSREGIRTQLPIEVKGHRFFYIVDKDGKFYNARLFDYSVGMHRML